MASKDNMRPRIYIEDMSIEDFPELYRDRGYLVEGDDTMENSLFSILLMLMEHCNELEVRIDELENPNHTPDHTS